MPCPAATGGEPENFLCHELWPGPISNLIVFSDRSGRINPVAVRSADEACLSARKASRALPNGSSPAFDSLYHQVLRKMDDVVRERHPQRHTANLPDPPDRYPVQTHSFSQFCVHPF